jgi:hypothetical protein
MKFINATSSTKPPTEELPSDNVGATEDSVTVTNVIAVTDQRRSASAGARSPAVTPQRHFRHSPKIDRFPTLSSDYKSHI